MASTELVISENLTALSDNAVEHTPTADKKVQVRIFSSGGESSALVSIRLYWKYGQAGETLIWVLAPDGTMPFVHAIPDDEVNGINKIGLVIDNGNLSSRFISGYALIEEND
jgi:hypothetical protein